jgi:serine phosphatase RsbU (regulator of sigma subunit)
LEEEEEEKLLDLIDHQKKVVKIISEVSRKVNSSIALKTIFNSTFELLDTHFGFQHIMILMLDPENQEHLIVYASHGYDGKGIGAKVPMGKGVIGTVAKNKKYLRMGAVRQNLRYVKSVITEKESGLVELPGIENCSSHLAVPLLFNTELEGVISVESTDLANFNSKDEELLQMLGVQIGIAINNANQFDIIEANNVQLKDLNENLEQKVVERTLELAEQKEIVEKKNREVTDSIRYALRFQDSMLPSADALKMNLDDCFVIFKPKDIVSGDFYWTIKQSDRVYFCVADCTGHGVPGAFVSMIGNVALRRALIEIGLIHPAEILDNISEFIEKTINKAGDIKDGMDMSLCCINHKTKQLEFSGAYNNALILRNGELIELIADKQPIGSYEYRTPFKTQVFDLQDKDRIYLTTDGFIDQFGGPRGKKFMKKRYKELIVENQTKRLSAQKVIFEKALSDWQGDIEQIDDICVMAVEYSG